MNKGSLKDYIRLLEKENAEMREVLCRATSTADSECEGIFKEEEE